MYLALRSGLRRFTRNFPGSALLGNTAQGDRIPFAYGAVTLCGANFHNASARYRLCNSSSGLLSPPAGPTTPSQHRQQAVPLRRFGLFPFRSPLLRESLLLSFPRGTEMFQFPRFPLPALCVQTGVTPHDGCRVSSFGHPRIDAWSTAPRGLSQSPTSFFGFRRQGIHRWLFVAWRTKMLVLAMEFSRINVKRLTLDASSSLPQNGIEDRSGSTVGGRNLRPRISPNSQ